MASKPRSNFKNRAKRIAEVRNSIADLYEAGQSINEIARTLNTTRQAILYHLRQMENEVAGPSDS